MQQFYLFKLKRFYLFRCRSEQMPRCLFTHLHLEKNLFQKVLFTALWVCHGWELRWSCGFSCIKIFIPQIVNENSSDFLYCRIMAYFLFSHATRGRTICSGFCDPHLLENFSDFKFVAILKFPNLSWIKSHIWWEREIGIFLVPEFWSLPKLANSLLVLVLLVILLILQSCSVTISQLKNILSMFFEVDLPKPLPRVLRYFSAVNSF